MLHAGHSSPTVAGQSLRLLLISDDVPSSEPLRSHLSRHGFTVAIATSARTAVHATEEVRPDVVLIDAAVHGGWRDVVRSIDELVPRGRIGVLAAYWSTEARREATALGIGGTFLKQLEGEDLADQLAAMCQAASAAVARTSSTRTVE